MQSYYIKPKSFYDSLGDVQPSQPYSYAYGDRPVFEFVFLPNEIAEGDTLVFAVDNDMVFYDNAPENLLHSASCMVVVRHYVTAEEATAGKVQLRIETRTVKFRDVTNGKVRPVEVISGLYRRRGDGDDVSYVLLARGRAFANGIIADYDALPEPITTDEYYTKGDIDGLLGEKADEATLVAHTDNADIHVTMQDKTTWDSKADIGDIGNATVTITQGGETRGSFSVNATDSVTIDLTGGAQADWNETDTASPAYIQHKPSVYTKTETDGMLDAKADKASMYTKTETDGMLDAKADKASVYTKTETDGLLDGKADKASVYTKTETDGLLDAKANVATTLSGYGIQDAYTKDETNSLLDAKADKSTTLAGYGIADAYTKTEVDAKVSSVYRYKGTVSTYADLPSSGQEVGDVWNIETADSTHGIKAGDNVAWNGSVWDALSGAVDLTPFALKAEAGTDHNHDGTYIPVTGCPLTNFSVEGKRADGSSIGTGRISYTVEDRTDTKVDNLEINTRRLRLYSNEMAFIAKPTLGGREANQKGGFVISDYYTGDIKAPGEFIEGNTKLSDKYATKSHTHAMGDITGLPASGGTAGQVLTKTETGSEWADAPAGGDNTTDYLCFTADEANSTVRLDKNGTPSTISLEYSTDKKTWTEYTWSGNTGATITLANIGDKVWWRGDNTTLSADSNKYYKFVMSGKIKALGNIMSLIDKTCKSVTIPTAYCFAYLFNGCTSLTKAPELPAKTLAKYCYNDMFSGCRSLTKAPELPATTLAESCYCNMFGGCRSLTKAPELPATTLALGCYKGMFGGCSSLTKAPELPATTLAESCYYNMFGGCSSLTKEPELPATTLAESCYYNMFAGCSSLTKAPELPATVLANSCYMNMFYNCNALKKVKVGFYDWKSGINATTQWLTNVSSTGVFECPSVLDCSTRDNSHVPAGWTIARTDSPKSITSPTTASSEATYQVSPSTPSVPVVTVASALTLNASTVDSGSVTYAEVVLDVATGATVTAGTNMTLVDTPTAGKRNICVCRWSGGACKLYVTIVEDLPQA